jgi:cytochrome P450
VLIQFDQPSIYCHFPTLISSLINFIFSSLMFLSTVHKWSAASLYMGGTDTIVSALMTFFLAMTLFPQVQPHARAEIDRTIGSKRLPLSTDKPNLLYIEAVVKETHRWHPVGPMSIPHASSREDTVLGYRVPKGAVLLP